MIYIQKMILLGTLSVIYAHIKNNIIKDPFYDLHTKNDTIREPFLDLHTQNMILLGTLSVIYTDKKRYY
jgi:hypothetical protein